MEILRRSSAFKLVSSALTFSASAVCSLVDFHKFFPSLAPHTIHPPDPMNRVLKFACPFRLQGCSRRFRSQGGRTYHIRSCHTNYNEITPPPCSPEPGAHEPRSPSSVEGYVLDIPIQDQDQNFPLGSSPPQRLGTQATKKYHPWLTGE